MKKILFLCSSLLVLFTVSAQEQYVDAGAGTKPTSKQLQKLAPEKKVVSDANNLPDLNMASYEDHIFTVSEISPRFNPDNGLMEEWIQSNVTLPDNLTEEEMEELQGTVSIRVIVEKDGKISNPQIINSINPVLDQEALRIAGIMPDWIPGKNQGVNVRTYVIIPFEFNKQETKK